MLGADDATLLRRVARGDTTAFGVLYDRLSPMVLIRLRGRCADAEVVADVLQDSFAAVWQSAGQWDGRGEVAGWVWTIAARRLVDAYRRRAVRAAAAERNAAVTTAEVAPSAEAVVLDELLGSGLEAALCRLSPELREVLQATVLDGLSTREAAVLLGVPEGTVKARAFRARSVLRQALA
ncbi:RNA polymerase subunit sigma-24 [Actinoplanes sp. ATCC 53533]|uniref:RNA polymerase sigma factor n=1 Tax=Actinoplanes sp. ATCC 53533 TaxID=1288362 RepID=UPI000F7A0D08|nr:RNA polymerase sigma factor [Actinoplanes sp. ATCC 53533]RSM73258.1 RNA polymerase subunit sigma-24 [Actinoplanes sp. ATCC 53533]